MDGEYYIKDGVNYDRVTRILDYFKDEGYWNWVIKVGKRESKRIGTIAMNIGTVVDEAIKEDILHGTTPKFKKQEEKNCFEAYMQWKRDYNVADAKVAETIYDDAQRVAGTPDLWLPDETLDIKCSSEIRESYWLQTNWYAIKKGHAWRSVLRLDKGLGMYEYKRIPVSQEDLLVFEGLTRAFRFYNKTVTDGEGVNNGDNATNNQERS